MTNLQQLFHHNISGRSLGSCSSIGWSWFGHIDTGKPHNFSGYLYFLSWQHHNTVGCHVTFF